MWKKLRLLPDYVTHIIKDGPLKHKLGRKVSGTLCKKSCDLVYCCIKESNSKGENACCIISLP